MQLLAFLLYVAAVVAFQRLHASTRGVAASVPEPRREPAVLEPAPG